MAERVVTVDGRVYNRLSEIRRDGETDSQLLERLIRSRRQSMDVLLGHLTPEEQVQVGRKLRGSGGADETTEPDYAAS